MDQLKKALNCHRSVFIQACAGAGKTFALTKRYAAILNNFAENIEKGEDQKTFDHKQILVITFTKKATAEMNERILKDVNLLLAGKEINELRGQDFCPTLRKSKHEDVLAFTRKLKDTFSKNAISTIDSFCAGILREFAYKLDLDPQFLSQDEHDTKKLLNETLDAWISEKLTTDPDYFHDVLDEFSFYEIKEILKSMYGSREILDDYLKEFEGKSDDDIWKDWLIRYTPAGEIENLAVTLKAVWKDAQDLCTNKDDALYVGLKELYDAMSELDNLDPLEYRAFLISDVFRKSIFVTQSGTYIKTNKGQAGNWTDKKERVMGWFQNLKDTIAEEDLFKTPGKQDKRIIPILRSLIRNYREFDEYFTKIRMDRDLLDFSDVIILTHKLLSEHEDVRRILGKRYRHIMLDEFQDTNPLRWEIIKMILEAGEDIKLFIVGDRKQSIYRFNNADVTVMNAAEDMVRSLNGEILDFNDNYRSSQTLIDEAINPLMRRILKDPDENREKYEAVFEDTASPNNKSGLANTIERIWCTGENNGDYTPAVHTAYQVKRLLKEYQNSEIDEKKDKPLIAVLLRRFTKISDYVQAFHQFGIPVSIFGGKNFYSSTALNDIFHLISVLDNPMDDHALIGLLRSPIIALPDPLINRLADRGKRSAFDAMGSIPELQTTYREILIWREQLRAKALDELIAEIIDERDRELGYVSELMPEQQLANIDKALNIIRGLQRGGSSLREIREYLHYQIQTGADESQAVYPAEARVQILTVHKAKGLEFPIVVIPEMNTKGNSDKNKFRYGRSHECPEISLSLSDDDKPGLLMRLKEITKREEEAEEKRVFYVAVTRAIQKVVLLGEGDKDKKALSHGRLKRYALGIENAEDADREITNWGDDVEFLDQKALKSGIDPRVIETADWHDEKQFENPGTYLYRTPHDLMNSRESFSYGESLTGLGTAPGSIFHYCMEKGWLDADAHRKEIRQHMSAQYPDLPANDLWEKVAPWLSTVNTHDLGTVLRDPGIKKYHELKVKGWLGSGGNVVQVNGTIDLLYKKDGQWTILDFKTDADKRRLPDYRTQLQSYQWMVKQAYGIDADANIYFVALDELEDVQWDDAYFDHLPFDQKFKPEFPPSKAELSVFLPTITDGDHLILCASAQHEEQIYLAMAKYGLLRPDIEICTLSKFLQEGDNRNLSQDTLRLMIRHRNPGMKNGTAGLLAKALRDEELLKGTVKSDFLSLYKNISNEPGYRSAASPYYLATAGKRRVILLDVYLGTELEKGLIERLGKETDLIRLSSNPDRRGKTTTLLEAFSPREEVLACAEHILKHRKDDEQILIAVASMEKYAPHLQRQFPKYGLRARFIGPKSLYEVPCTSLLMNYLRSCATHPDEWQAITPLLLHPNMKTDDQLFDLDKLIRQHPMEDHALPETGLHFSSKPSDLTKDMEAFIQTIITDNDVDTCRACDKFLELLGQVMSDLAMIDPRITIADIHREMSERIKKESIPRRDQWNGIPVVGLLDSLGVQADRLYVLGMVEGDIPRQESDNPFLIKTVDHSLELNRHFMKEWKKLGDRVIFSTSTHAEDGSEQRRSSFLEGLDLEVIAGNGRCRRDELLDYDNKMISGHASPLVERHHEIMKEERGIYSGEISRTQEAFDLRVTAVDTLLACQMRYYFDDVMKCPPMDQSDALYWGSKRGSVIHKAFEAFINGNGYALDIENGLKLMSQCLDQALTEERIDKNDPKQMDQFRHYIKDLTAGSDKNCLAVNLKMIKDNYADYSRFESEKDFTELRLQHPSLSIELRGRIDKIMFNDDEKKLIASDYKTGSIKTSLLSKMMLSQLYLYLSYCAEAYPDYEQKAMYELLKKPKDCGMTEYMQVNDEFKQMGKNAKQSFNIEEFEQHLQELFTGIGAGKYYITEKDFNDACVNCNYEFLCRKNTRLKIKEN